MEREINWLGQERQLDISQLYTLFECARYFSALVDDAVSYKNHLNDIIIYVENGMLYLIDEDVELYPLDGNVVNILVPARFEGYEIQGKNFLMEVYE